MASECSNKRKRFGSPTLNQKLEIFKISKGGTFKAKTDQKLGLLHHTVSQVMNTKEKFLSEVKSTTPVNT